MNTTDATTVWTVDPAHAELAFSVRHLMISNVRGRFGKVEGTVTVDNADPNQSKIDVTIDVNSIDTRQEMRDNHLRSADFFDAGKHPTMHFVSKRIAGDVTKDFQIIGDLTIRGTTREIELNANLEGRGKDPWGNERAGFHLSGSLNRHDFGLNWNQALEAGGVTVGAEVKISIDVEIYHKLETLSAAA
ncbi:MAG TPA: YceI family protein [Gemmatimonadaceae bacterium]|jgi:polyisoprenoid-binding protein YceI|nr:YceI family protein [Gemmatimonadaceae bacterium]